MGGDFTFFDGILGFEVSTLRRLGSLVIVRMALLEEIGLSWLC